MPVLFIKFGKELIPINHNDILYIEARNKYSIFYLKESKKIESHDSLKLISTQLKEPRFYRTHGSFIVNCSFIVTFNSHHITLHGEKKVPLSRNKKESFKTNLANYHSLIEVLSITPQ